MIEDPEAPLVPEIRRRNRVIAGDTDEDSVREERDALRMQAPFVPMVSKRRAERLGEKTRV